MSELISVIVPVYKVEEYIEECVYSLIKQTYQNLEIVLVDDGSPDTCPSICERFAREDRRIKVFHKKNGGLSDARNYGTQYASGDIVMYVDSDDFVESDIIEKLYNQMHLNGADVAISCHDETNNVCAYDKLDGNVIVGTGMEILMVMLKDFSWSAWGKLFRKSILSSRPFVKGILYEDFECIPKLMLNAKKAVLLKQPLYHYRVRENSIMANSKKGFALDYISIAKGNINYFARFESPAEKRDELLGLLFIRLYRDFCKQYSDTGSCFDKSFAKQEKILIRENLVKIFKNKSLPNKYKEAFALMAISVPLYGKMQTIKIGQLRLK